MFLISAPIEPETGLTLIKLKSLQELLFIKFNTDNKCLKTFINNLIKNTILIFENK